MLFAVVCMSSINKTMNNLELAKLDYPDVIIDRLIEQGRVSNVKALSVVDRVKKWPATIVLGIIIGLIVRYVNWVA